MLGFSHFFFFFSSRRRHTRFDCDWSSDVCSSDLVLTAVLYLLIFGHVLEGRVLVYDRISYTAFLIPGLVMMSVLQNAFANSSSRSEEHTSELQSQSNLVCRLLLEKKKKKKNMNSSKHLRDIQF